jgi:hypothetical protein
MRNFFVDQRFLPVLILVLHKAPRREDVWGGGGIFPHILNIDEDK